MQAAPSPVCNVKEFGATGDGVHKETTAIAKAISACVANGGGVVYFPAGKFLTGAITLASNITLQVGPGATLLGSPDPADYPLRQSPWGGEQIISSLIYGKNLENVSVTGPGTIDGQGLVWWKRQWLITPKKNVPPITDITLAQAKQALAHGRPHMIKIVSSKHVRLEGLTLINSASWTVNPVFSEFVNITGLTIINPVPSPNTDGINPESCREVHIANCHIDVGDDCITLKSGKDEAGRRAARPNENITITGCTMRKGHGGVVIGSEMSGGVRNVAISNCVFNGTDKGIRIKSQRGRGGVVEGITADNIVMQDVPEAINITTFYSGSDTIDEKHPVGEGTPRFRDIRISNVTARGSKTAGSITGLEEMPISEITLSNVRIQAAQGFLIRNAKDIAFYDVRIDAAKGPAIYGNNIDGLEISGFRKPVMDLKSVQNLLFRGFSAP